MKVGPKEITGGEWEVDENFHFFNTGGGRIVFGNGVDVGPFCSIVAADSILIGNDTLIAPGVTIVDHDHNIGKNPNEINKTANIKPVVIGKKCWIGANAVILKGVELGDYCVVGAGAVVLSGKYEKGSILVGVPAEVKRIRQIEEKIE